MYGENVLELFLGMFSWISKVCCYGNPRRCSVQFSSRNEAAEKVFGSGSVMQSSMKKC